MAKFRVAYGLCPLIDNSSLLGVNVDRDADCVIVTIGRNIVIRYKFQDQKQVNSWSSKEKLTSPVVYNSFDSVYTAIFNQDQLRMWKEEDQLDKVKKYKFQEPLHSVIPDPDGNDAFLLFRCGHVATITEALKTRKEVIKNTILDSKELIKDYTVLMCNGTKYIAFISCGEECKRTLNVVPVACGTSTIRYNMYHQNSEEVIVGFTIMSKNNTGVLITLWSDGSLFSFNFLPVTDVTFPGIFLQNITNVNTKHPVAVSAVSNSHLAFFGADSSEEGAMLVLFNLQFQLIQARLHFKLYTKPPRMWNVNNHLLVTVGNNLIVVPYLLEVEQLSNLVGIHSAPTLHMTEANWETAVKSNKKTSKVGFPKKISKSVESLRLEGCPETTILEKILPDLMKEEDNDSILWCLKNFLDFPESFIVQLLMFCLCSSSISFNSKIQKRGQKEMLHNGLPKSVDKSQNTRDLETHYSKKQIAILEAVLNLSFNESCLIPKLRALPFSTVMDLLKYLNDLLDRQSTVPSDKVMIWICLVLDSHYQEYLLSQNKQVFSLLSTLKEKVHSEMECLEDLKRLRVLLHRLRCGKVPFEPLDKGEKKYSVEILHLY